MAKKNQKQPSKSGGNSGVDLHEVERLLDFMEKHGLEEFEYERDGVRIRLRKPSAHVQGRSRSVTTTEDTAYGSPEPPHTTTAPGSSSARETAAEKTTAENLHIVKSPIVGTFYASASPESDPFVTVGSRVESGQALCIIEAMKLMNEIEADVAGEITKIFVENGQPVEYGEPLFGINPRKK
jgi:acetyl-CoA carboxylase biotin carboxyl carrier protein